MEWHKYGYWTYSTISIKVLYLPKTLYLQTEIRFIFLIIQRQIAEVARSVITKFWHMFDRDCSLIYTRNTLDCDQSNYSSRIVFPTYLLNLVQVEIAPFDRRPRKPHRRTKHEVDRMTPCGDMAIWFFPNERSVVGRSSIYTSSYTNLIILLFAHVRSVAREE